MDIHTSVERMREHFNTGNTLPVRNRLADLKRLQAAIQAHEQDIYQALAEDLGKSQTEAYMCEVGLTLSELTYQLRHLRQWAKPQRVKTPLAHFPSKSYTVSDPYGVVLIMSPWNYPFMLTMEPLIGALACGNCCVVKPSAYAPATAAVIKEILQDAFDRQQVLVVEGGRAENQLLLEQRFDYIFFTGGVTVGTEVMRHAAENLTPVTLELGGKSPVLVDGSANIDLAARRIAFGKLLNSGQTCVAPDYVLVEKCVEDQLIDRLKHYFVQMAGEKPLLNEDYVHIVNRKHFDRVTKLIDQDKLAFGGQRDAASLRIAPTILRDVCDSDPVMQEEIFGPVLPVMSVDTIGDGFEYVKSHPHPLACYLFTRNRKVRRRYETELAFGGGCINDCIIHLATSNMGFGGVGQSGMGSYHGHKSFETFSHQKSIVKKSTIIDMPIRYMPYTSVKEKLLHRFL